MFHLWRERNIIIVIYDRLNAVDTKNRIHPTAVENTFKNIRVSGKTLGGLQDCSYTSIARCWQRKLYNFSCALRDNNRYTYNIKIIYYLAMCEQSERCRTIILVDRPIYKGNSGIVFEKKIWRKQTPLYVWWWWCTTKYVLYVLFLYYVKV